MNETFMIPLPIELAAVALGGMQGALYAAGFKRLDLLGVAVIAIVSALGGGVIRDVLLGLIPVSLTTNITLFVCVVAGLVGMLLQRVLIKVDPIINILDALVLGTFTALATTKALAHGIPALPALLIGVFAAVGGGMIRDLLLNMPIAVMHVGSLYAVAALTGSITTVALLKMQVDVEVAGIICVIITAALRLLSIRFGWSLPAQRAFDRRRRKKQREVEATLEAIRTQTIKLEQLPDINPQGPYNLPSAN